MSDVALPKSLNYQLPSKLPDACRAYTMHQPPTGANSVTGSTAIANAFVVKDASNGTTNSSGMVAVPFNNQTITIDIPAGNGPGIFLDPKETNLSFRLTWTVTTASSVANGLLQLLSSGASWFNSVSLQFQGNPIDQINNYDMLANMLLQSTVNQSERYGLMSIGCDNDTFAGIDLNHASTNPFYYNFTIPLINLLGLNGSDQLIPIGAIGSLQLVLNTATNIPFTSFCTATTTQPVISAPVLDQFMLNLRYVDIGENATAMLYKSLPDGKFRMKATSYLSNSVTIPVGTAGEGTIVHQIRAKSVKSVFYTFNQGCSTLALAALTPNGNIDSFNPALIKAQVSLGNGLKMPNRQLDPSRRPQEAFANLIQAFGGASLKSMGGCLNRNAYGATLPSAPSNSDASIVIPFAGLRGGSIITINPSSFYLGFNMERVVGSGSIFSGVDTTASGISLDVGYGVATANNITCTCFALVDVIIEVDPSTKTITVLK